MLDVFITYHLPDIKIAVEKLNKTRGRIPQVNYTDQATAAYR
jgi:hypothetical protein